MRATAKRKTLLRWLLLPLFIAAAVMSVELVSNLRVLSLPQDQKGVVTIDLSGVSVSYADGDSADDAWSDEDEWYGDDFDEEDWEEDETFSFYDEEEEGYSGSADEALILEGKGASVALPYSGYVSLLTLEGAAAGTETYTVSWTGPEETEGSAGSWFAGFLQEDSVRVGAEVRSLGLTLEGDELALTGVKVDNSFVWNWQRMLLVGLLAAAFGLLITFRAWYADHMPCAFLTVALAAGIWMCLAVPMNVGFSYDDQVHVQNVFELAGGSTVSGALEQLTESVWKGRDGETYLELDTRKDQAALARLQREADAKQVENSAEKLWEFSYTGYAAQVGGVWLGRLLGLGLRGQFFLARICNMLAFVLLTFAALSVLQRFRFTLAAIALAPAALFNACSFSYDPLGTGLCFLGIALAVDAMMDPDTRLPCLRGIGILFCICFGSLTKTVYIPLILLALLLPRSKFDSTGSRLVYKGFAVALFLAVLLTRVFQTLGNTAIIEDARAEASDSAGQLAFLLANPFVYLHYFFTYLFGHFQLFFLDSWRVSLAYVGDVTGVVGLASLLLLLFTAFTDHDDRLARSTLRWYQRLGMFVVASLVVGLVFTVMYVAYSSVGELDFIGVQPRYLLPALPLFYFLLSPDGIRNRMNRIGWTLTFSLANLAILGYVCWSMILVPWGM